MRLSNFISFTSNTLTPLTPLRGENQQNNSSAGVPPFRGVEGQRWKVLFNKLPFIIINF